MKKNVVNMSAQVCNNETIKEEYMFLLLPVRAGYEQLTCKIPLAVIFSVECFTLPQAWLLVFTCNLLPNNYTHFLRVDYEKPLWGITFALIVTLSTENYIFLELHESPHPSGVVEASNKRNVPKSFSDYFFFFT